jgi:hypothetical protein
VFPHTNYYTKIFSHQLTKDFAQNASTSQPSPNLFTTYANQIADNAASQGREITRESYLYIHYPPFSPRWCFSFTKVHVELELRLQHRVKQGLFQRLTPFVGLHANQIGYESMLCNIVKLTTPCWTRSIYRYLPLIKQLWEHWRSILTWKTYTCRQCSCTLSSKN